MRVINVVQQSEAWDRWRNRPTASEFGKVVTPTRGDYSTQASGYAAKIVAKRLGVYTEPPTSFWMDWGTEHEPNAKHAYTKSTGLEIQDVGFVVPDGTDAYGCSPDGLVGDDGIIEIKCPKPETLIAYHASGKMPDDYKPQVQGQLLITGREWCDFYVYHPELTPFLLRIEPDEAYQARIAEGLLLLLREIERIEGHVSKMRHELVSVATTRTDMRFDDEG
jgi:hypothetical protein